MVHGRGTCRDNLCQVHRRLLRFCHIPVFFFLFLHPLRHRFGAASQAEILSAASRAEMADVVQMICDLVFGVDIPNLNFGIQIETIKQPIQSNSVIQNNHVGS